ncbi:hypothetical protein N0V83_006812 [Neocucurbitaria cava]|uniref:Uncharacterized protein n=1 Tax=Neocucurbitaria cava TaxID=798079 RepID=A0A9W8Y606_9PLEO|nr:hypothetical protein N0V83_006812 [Neocucurbitaria cava]
MNAFVCSMNSAGDDEDGLEPLYAYDTNEKIQDFPKTRADFDQLPGVEVKRILEAIEAPTDGTAEERNKRLKIEVGYYWAPTNYSAETNTLIRELNETRNEPLGYEARLEQEDSRDQENCPVCNLWGKNDKLMPLAAYDTGKDVLNFPETRADLLKLPDEEVERILKTIRAPTDGDKEQRLKCLKDRVGFDRIEFPWTQEDEERLNEKMDTTALEEVHRTMCACLRKARAQVS